MKALLAALLFPALSLAAGYPPGTTHITGHSLTTWDDLYMPNGYAVDLWLRWDGGDTFASLAGTGFSTFSVDPMGYVNNGVILTDGVGDPRPGYSDERPDYNQITIENGLLRSFRYGYGHHDAIFLQVDFELGTYNWHHFWDGSHGTLNRAPGYVEDAVVPEPQTWTLLLAGFAAIAALGRRRRAALRYQDL